MLKLTTAAYRRPSGKNIHRFPISKDSDEWGVTPDPGYQLKLGDGELMEMVRQRRLRDIVQPHTRASWPARLGPKSSGSRPAGPWTKAAGTKPATAGRRPAQPGRRRASRPPR